MIKVYGAAPTRGGRVVWMLEEMGLPYEVEAVDFASRFDNADFMSCSPAGALPGMRDGEVRMMESVAIMEYIGARYGPTPIVRTAADPDYPAYVQYLHYGEASLASPLNVVLGTRFFAPEEHKQNWGAQFAIDMVTRRSKALVEPLKTGPYLLGQAFTAADISCGYALGLSRPLGFFEALDPVLQGYLERLTQRPAFQRAMHPKPA